MFAYCLNNPVNKVDSTGMWTFGISFGANLNLIFGVSISVGVFFDGEGNIDCQWSYSVPGVNDTASLGVLDAGVGLTFQYTNRDTVYDLYGRATYAGVSGGTGWYVGVDTISFSKPSDIDAKLDGFQLSLGLGAGFDAHVVVTDTRPVVSRGASSSSRIAGMRRKPVAMIA